ncbi:uncharacterized protein LOC128126086 [Lactuca sativa]|uniref:uncharacterized protein LOC128126086 n=1 Tax=Lactuca sativa TaxID=4236 RepID=UPI0022AEA681|nr:uncharacterized protein LOC128126086 [Lactuca sativa]
MCCCKNVSPDFIDDSMRMSERTARESLYRLARGVVETFSDKYFLKPSLNDMKQLYVAFEERHDFSGMLGSIDCTKWIWRNCPVAWKDQYTSGHLGSPFVGKALDAPFTVNVNEYKFGHCLTDIIYPSYSMFVKAFRHPIKPIDKISKRRQEGARKDVERAFGVLKTK